MVELPRATYKRSLLAPKLEDTSINARVLHRGGPHYRLFSVDTIACRVVFSGIFSFTFLSIAFMASAPVRYAIYYAPKASSMFGKTGRCWLGRDASNGQIIEQPTFPGVSAGLFYSLTANPRRYGFHATLKAPFRLADGCTETTLLERACDFSRRQDRIQLSRLEVDMSGGFLALHSAGKAVTGSINAFAQDCVASFDDLRAPINSSDRARRARSLLTYRQDQLLERWGYPHTEEAFRFHMTLTGGLEAIDHATRESLQAGARNIFDAVFDSEAIVLDAITIFREEKTGLPFKAWKRFEFA
jgi:hypothetical protein